jgi:hypothetical protein
MMAPCETGEVLVLLSGPSERLVLDTFGLLAQDYPRFAGAGFERAVAKLAARLPTGATPPVVSQFAVLLSEMRAAGRVPRIRLGRIRAAGRDEVFLVALLGAAQQGERGRAIEAAIALLDTGHVHAVVAAAAALGERLAENGIRLHPIAAATFDYLAGYPAVADPIRSTPLPALAPPGKGKRPTLHVLQSA